MDAVSGSGACSCSGARHRRQLPADGGKAAVRTGDAALDTMVAAFNARRRYTMSPLSVKRRASMASRRTPPVIALTTTVCGNGPAGEPLRQEAIRQGLMPVTSLATLAHSRKRRRPPSKRSRSDPGSYRSRMKLPVAGTTGKRQAASGAGERYRCVISVRSDPGLMSQLRRRAEAAARCTVPVR